MVFLFVCFEKLCLFCWRAKGVKAKGDGTFKETLEGRCV